MKNTKSNEIAILNLMFPDEDTEAARFVGHQINVVDNMVHGLMTLAGILLAITAAILPSFANIPYWSIIFIVLGGSFVLASVLINAWFVFRVKWFTDITGNNVDMHIIKSTALSVRNKKTKGYHISLIVIIIGLIFYLLSLYMFVIFIR